MGRKATSEYNLAVIHPKVAKEWHPTKNKPLTPKDITPGSNKKVWWQCNKGHKWEALVKSRSRGRCCPECSGRKVGKDNNLVVIHPKVAKEWHPKKNKPLTPKDVTPGSNKRVWWKCGIGHEWQALISSRSRRNCPSCAKSIGVIKKKQNRIKSGNTLKKNFQTLLKSGISLKIKSTQRKLPLLRIQLLGGFAVEDIVLMQGLQIGPKIDLLALSVRINHQN